MDSFDVMSDVLEFGEMTATNADEIATNDEIEAVQMETDNLEAADNSFDDDDDGEISREIKREYDTSK